MGLAILRALRQHSTIALDTSIFIYQLEANPRYLNLTDRIFAWLEAANHFAVTSTITMTELLVHPYRTSDEQQADQFYGLLSTYPNLSWIQPDLSIADSAARIRALHRLSTPDALQAATAIHSTATALITNAPVFGRIPNFVTIVLDQLLR